MKNRRAVLVTAVMAVALVTSGWFVQQPGSRVAHADDKARLFEDIIGYVSQYYVDSLDASDLYEMAIEGMLDRLGDPYTSYLQTEAYEELSLSTTGNYGGVGIRIETRDSWITIVGPIPDTPGDRAGLLPGDQIVEIEGKTTQGWTTQQAANVMRGEPGTDVQMKVVRAGVSDTMHYAITRARIHVNYVEGKVEVAPGVGYVQLTSVSQTAARELFDAINELRDQGIKSLILDLRANPGGILEQGVAIADLFLDPGDVVVEMKGRAPGASQTYRSERRERWPDMPIVALVGPRTASAAEIIAGALQDHDRALVVGTRTFGKGVAYVVLPLSQTEAVSVTTSRWYTPSGRSIDRPYPSVNGQIVARRAADSTAGDTVEFRSASGRVLQGGGGIRPDLELPDTLSAGEQEFVRLLGSNVPAYFDARARYALDLKGEATIADPAFEVSPAMLDELLKRLRLRGVEMSDSVWNSAGDLIAEQLGAEITRYVFGREAELTRQIMTDVQVQEAVGLLKGARSQRDLLARAQMN